MAGNLIVANPGKSFPLVKLDKKTRKPINPVERIKKWLGITSWSELMKGDEPYFGF
jgi:hypothetical protein